nr:hypothetical protein [Actinomycetota bacterium]NIS36302.1 hypothetical protein [Actinomycetota bacterium]NIT98648.1 hypothetical protein [Actinomycetota bacterium]NIU22264.1 hypothetical protein [Actinomycetota bacterium]NIU70847.1 hypothetical protein [Actinomycetota bacterium]
MITLVGTTDGDTAVALFRDGDLATPIMAGSSDGAGDFAFPMVVLATGANAFTVVTTDLAGNTGSGGRTVTTTAADTMAPIVTARLANDTGRSATDRITNDPTITGVVDDVSPITSFVVSLDGAPFADVSAFLSGSGFTLTTADLDSLAGGSLAQGLHRIQFV